MEDGRKKTGKPGITLVDEQAEREEEQLAGKDDGKAQAENRARLSMRGRTAKGQSSQ